MRLRFSCRMSDTQVGDPPDSLAQKQRTVLLITVALLQDPKFFNFAVEYFLDQQYDGPLPVY